MSKNTTNISTEPYKGVRDFYPEDMALQKYIFETWKRVVERFGYTEYTASILEPAELYKAKSGEEIINEQTYTFIDRGEREVTLRPEMTPTVARMVAAKKRELGFPLRWYSIPNLFRYERPQKGRMREHWQLNVDCFGLAGIEADIEGITVANEIMKEFGAKESDFEIRVSSRKLLNALFSYWYELDEPKAQALQKLIDKKAKMSSEIFSGEAEKIVGEPFKFLNLDPSDEDFAEAMSIPQIKEAKEELNEMISRLRAKGMQNIVYDKTLIRGFDYYTATVFEFQGAALGGAQNALGGGGRYDRLSESMGGPNAPAIGFGSGIERVLLACDAEGVLAASQQRVQVFVIDALNDGDATRLVHELRSLGISADRAYGGRAIKKQWAAANKAGAAFGVMLAEREAAAGVVAAKDLFTGAQCEVARVDVATWIREQLSKGTTP